MSSEQLKQEVMALPLSEQVSLAQALWESIDAGLADTDQRVALREAVRRDQEMSSGVVDGCTHDQVMQAARRSIGCDDLSRPRSFTRREQPLLVLNSSTLPIARFVSSSTLQSGRALLRRMFGTISCLVSRMPFITVSWPIKYAFWHSSIIAATRFTGATASKAKTTSAYRAMCCDLSLSTVAVSGFAGKLELPACRNTKSP